MDRQNGRRDSVPLEAANAIAGAIKTGKAVAQAAKGAAVGGPYGAAIAALWANRQTMWKAVAGLAAVLNLPLVYLMMLPSIMFGGLYTEYEQPILNNDMAVLANVKQAEQAVWLALKESHDRVIEEIHSEIENLGRYERGIINDSYTDTIPFDSTLILSQYSASKAYKEISLDDLSDTLKAG